MTNEKLPYVEFEDESFWPYEGKGYPATATYRPFEELQEWMLKQGFKVERVEPTIPWPEPGIYWSAKVEQVFTCDKEKLESIDMLYWEDDESDDWRGEILPLVLMTETGVTIG